MTNILVKIIFFSISVDTRKFSFDSLNVSIVLALILLFFLFCLHACRFYCLNKYCNTFFLSKRSKNILLGCPLLLLYCYFTISVKVYDCLYFFLFLH